MHHSGSTRWEDRVWVGFLGAFPLRTYTSAVRAIAQIPVPRSLRQPVLGTLAARLGMDLSEAEHSIEEYPSFGDLFVRRLRGGLRPVDADPRLVISPVDGCISSFGPLAGDRILQAKGIDYSVAELVGDPEYGDLFADGRYLTIYLRPKDYHRIHAPFDGEVLSTQRVPGELFPVQPSVVRTLKGVFVRNERLAMIFDTPMGKAALVCVGATAVGCITTVFGSGPHGAEDGLRRYQPPLKVDKGQEIAAFNLGSTVILVFQKGAMEFEPLEANQELRLGQVVGRSESKVPRS